MDPIILAAALLAPQIMEAIATEHEVVGLPAAAPADVRRSYPERRWYLQSQSWWRPQGEQGVGEHVHVEAAVPIGQTVSGTLTFDIRVQLHEQPAGTKVNYVRCIDDRGVQLFKIDTRTLIVANSEGNADVWLKGVKIDTTRQTNGRREYRFTANIGSKPGDGARQFQSTGWCWWVKNGTASNVNGRSDTFHEARGWYTDFDYTNARFESLFPFNPVSGIWTFKVALKPGSGGEPVTAHMVTIDPDFHHDHPGTTIKQGSGKYEGNVTINTASLSNGVHRLVLIAHADKDGKRNSGVLVIPIVVRN